MPEWWDWPMFFLGIFVGAVFGMILNTILGANHERQRPERDDESIKYGNGRPKDW